MHPLTRKRAARACLLFLLATLLSFSLADQHVRAAGEDNLVGLVLSNLPPQDSAEYAELQRLGGQAAGQSLEMTKSEMWSVPADKVEALSKAAAARGVIITRLDDNANQMFRQMKPGTDMTAGQSGIMSRTMASKSVMGMEMVELPPADVMEYALTRPDTADGSPPSLIVPLDANTSITVRRTSVEKAKDHYVWRGVIDGMDQMVTFLWWPSGRLAGTIHYRGHMYAVKSMGGGMHGIVEVAPQMLPDEHAPAPVYMLEQMQMKEDPLVTQGDASMLRPSDKDGSTPGKGRPSRSETKDLEDAFDGKPAEPKQSFAPIVKQSQAGKRKGGHEDITITLIIAYTRQAAAHYGSIEHDLLAVAIADANQSFRNSGLGHIRLELAHAYQTDYVEQGGHFDHVWRFADKGDGYMDEIHTLRDQYRADVGLLLVHDPTGCGLATRVAADWEEAFAVVHHECAALTYSIAHEVGHILGARHDHALDQNIHPFPHGHGFVHGTKWRTMMSYKKSCDGCPRLPVWSSPEIKVNGVAAGSKMEDNAKVIADEAARVAGFKNQLGRNTATSATNAELRP